jgi:hypothetical protein
MTTSQVEVVRKCENFLCIHELNVQYKLVCNLAYKNDRTFKFICMQDYKLVNIPMFLIVSQYLISFEFN